MKATERRRIRRRAHLGWYRCRVCRSQAVRLVEGVLHCEVCWSTDIEDRATR